MADIVFDTNVLVGLLDRNDALHQRAKELGLEHCFVAFLPKPTIMPDDQAAAEWRLCRHVHPFNVDSIEAEE